jgi:hypothetical protein
MKRVAATAAMIILVWSFGFSQDSSASSAAGRVPPPKFSVKLGGGGSYATLGDLARGIDGQMAYLGNDYPDLNGSFETPLFGPGFAGEVLFRFAGRFSAGLGVGSIRHARESQVEYTISFIEAKERIFPKLSVVPITAGLHYALPLGRAIKLDFTAGAGYYLASLDYEYRMDLSLLGFTGYDIYTFKGRSGGLGFHGGIGLELALGRRLALCLDVLGRAASIDGFEGDWLEQGGGDFWEYDDSGSGHRAWFYVWEFGGQKYDQIVFQADQPSGSLVSGVRSAKIDLTGFTAALSLKIGLF